MSGFKKKKPDRKRLFKNVAASVWINTKGSPILSVMFQMRVFYEDCSGSLRLAKSYTKRDIPAIKEALNWIESIDIDEFEAD